MQRHFVILPPDENEMISGEGLGRGEEEWSKCIYLGCGLTSLFHLFYEILLQKNYATIADYNQSINIIPLPVTNFITAVMIISVRSGGLLQNVSQIMLWMTWSD